MPNHSNQQKTESSSNINFSASHDQACLSHEMSTNYTELKKIPNALEEDEISLQKIRPEGKTLAELQELINEINEKQTTTIKLVEYSKQVVENLHTTATKLNAIYQKTPEEKLKAAQALLTKDQPLNKNEQCRFKKIEEALSNTCIIKSAGDETIKFQLGVLGNARKNNLISQSEFDYLVTPRLVQNNLLDDYRLKIEGGMILKQLNLGICQAINQEISLDPDYQDSKKLFAQRFKGIGYELSSEKLLDNIWKTRGLEKRHSLWEAFNTTAPLNTADDLEGKAFDLPKLVLTSSERH